MPPDDAQRWPRRRRGCSAGPSWPRAWPPTPALSVERFTWRRHRASLARLYGLAPAQPARRLARPRAADGEAPDDVLGRTEFLWSDPGQRWRRRPPSPPPATSASVRLEGVEEPMMRLLVVLGEGGHTRQMLQLLDQLGPQATSITT